MAKTKTLSLDEVLEILPSLTHEDLLKLKSNVDQEHENRVQKATNDLAVLKHGGK